jgi:hypothetical protein
MKQKSPQCLIKKVYTILLLSVLLLGLSGIGTAYATDQFASAIDWNDDHSATGFIVQWRGMKFDTRYHSYAPYILEEHALDVLEYKEEPPGTTNFWFPQNVQVNAEKDELQLVMRRYGPEWEGQPVWSCAEVVLEEKLYYGKYSITVKSYGFQDVDDRPADPDPWGSLFDEQNTVLGIFTYDSNADWDSENPYREIDIIEVFGKVHSVPQIGNAQFVVQPYNAEPENLTRVTLPRPESGLLTFEMDLQKDSVSYAVRDGGRVVARHTYTDPEYIPVPNDSMRLHINLWVFGGPMDAKPKRVGITDLRIEKCEKLTDALP